MNRYKRLFSNTAIFAIGTVGSKLLVFLLMPLYTAWLTPEEFGAAEMITAVSNFIIPIACVGIGTGIFRFALDKELDKDAVFSCSIAILGGGLGVFALSSPLLLLLDYYRASVWLIVLYVIFANLQAVCAQYVRAIDRTALFAGQGIFNTALTIAFNVLFLFVFRMGVVGYVLSVVMGNFVTVLFLVWRAKLWLCFKPSKIHKPMMRDLLKFSIPIIPTTMCWLITDLSDRTMVTYFWGDAVNGIYAAAYKIPTIVTLLSGVFLQAWQFSALADTKNEEDCKKFYSQVFGVFLSVIMISGAGLIFLSKPLTALLLATSYFGASQYMPTLLCAAVLEAMVAFLATIYLVKKKSTHSFITALIGAGCNLILNLILIPSIGALGAAIATLASYALVLIVRLLDTRQMLRFSCRLPRLLCSSVLLLLMTAIETLNPAGRVWWSFGLMVVLVAIQLPELFSAFRLLLKRRRTTDISK